MKLQCGWLRLAKFIASLRLEKRSKIIKPNPALLCPLLIMALQYLKGVYKQEGEQLFMRVGDRARGYGQTETGKV